MQHVCRRVPRADGSSAAAAAAATCARWRLHQTNLRGALADAELQMSDERLSLLPATTVERDDGAAHSCAGFTACASSVCANATLFCGVLSSCSVGCSVANKNPCMTRAAAKVARAAASCPICLDVLHEPVVSPCGHVFCYDCVRQSLAYSMTCPVCRRPISSHRVLCRTEALATLAEELSGTSASRVARRIGVASGPVVTAVLGDAWDDWPFEWEEQ